MQENEFYPGFSRVTGNWNGYKWISKKKRRAIYIRDDWRCLYCERDLRKVRRGQRTLDHLRPRSKGGSNEARNLVTCCKRCNDERTSIPWRTFASPDAIRRIRRNIRRKLKPVT